MKEMRNLPSVHMGLVTVSRDCFPLKLASRRLDRLSEELETESYFRSDIVLQSESDIGPILRQLSEQHVNALTVYLGNFGPEGATALLIHEFQKNGYPVMVCAAAEENAYDLIENRGDAFCGLLNCSYNLDLRGIRAYIPALPVGGATRTGGRNPYLPENSLYFSRFETIESHLIWPTPNGFFRVQCSNPSADFLGRRSNGKQRTGFARTFPCGKGNC